MAKSVAFKVSRQLGIELNEETYRFLMVGFCCTGEDVAATKM